MSKSKCLSNKCGPTSAISFRSSLTRVFVMLHIVSQLKSRVYARPSLLSCPGPKWGHFDGTCLYWLNMRLSLFLLLHPYTTKPPPPPPRPHPPLPSVNTCYGPATRGAIFHIKFSPFLHYFLYVMKKKLTKINASHLLCIKVKAVFNSSTNTVYLRASRNVTRRVPDIPDKHISFV